MKTKRIFGLLTALVVTCSMTACGNETQTDNGTTGDSANTGGQTDSTERVPIRWLTTGDSAAKVIENGDRIIEEINNRLGIDLTVEIVPEGNTEKVNVAMASGNFSDVVTGAYGTSATQQWIDDGMVISLNHYMDSNSNIAAWLEDYEWSAQDENYYGLPFITQYEAANSLIVMREDWLDNLGLSYPKTLEDMKEVLTAFTYDDPDGNGQDDTFGYTAAKLSGANSTPFDWVFFAYGLEYADYTLDDESNVVAWFEDDSFVPAMQYIKELWDSGVIDLELMLNDNTRKEEKFYQGKVGSMLAPLFRHVGRHESSVQELFPEATITYGLPPAGTDGAMGLNRQGKSGMFTCITTACKNPDKAAEFLDFMVSKEGNNLLRLGIEGIHYTMDGDTVVFNEEERAKDAFSVDGWAHALAWGSFYWPLESGYLPDTEPNRERALETVELASEAQLPNLINQKTAVEIENASVAGDVFTQYFSDMLQGKIDIEEGAVKLSEEWRAQGGQEILDSVTEVYLEQQGQEQ